MGQRLRLAGRPSVVLTLSPNLLCAGSSRTPSLGSSSYPSQSYGEQQPKKVEPMSEGKVCLATEGVPAVHLDCFSSIHWRRMALTFPAKLYGVLCQSQVGRGGPRSPT